MPLREQTRKKERRKCEIGSETESLAEVEVLNRSELTKMKHAPFGKTLRKAQLQIFRQLQESVAALDAARVEFSDEFREIGVRDRVLAFCGRYFFRNFGGDDFWCI